MEQQRISEGVRDTAEVEFNEQPMINIIMRMKTVMVTLTKEDKEGNRYAIRLAGEEATKWAEAVNGQGMLAYQHGIKFPELKWEEI